MRFKEKLIGIILIVIGALPFLLRIQAINDSIGKYTWILPNGIVYQLVIVFLGILLLFKLSARVETSRY